MCFFLFLNASSERGSKPGVRRSLLSQHSPTLCYLKSVSSICIFRTSSEVSTRKIWMAFLFWIFLREQVWESRGRQLSHWKLFMLQQGSVSKCKHRSWSPVFKLIACFQVDHQFSGWSSVLNLVICFQVDHLFSNANTGVDYFASDLKIMADKCFKCHVQIHFNLLKTSVNCLSMLCYSID